MFDLLTDPEEKHDRLQDESLKPLIEHLIELALLHRNSGGHRLAKIASDERIIFDWSANAAQTARGLTARGLTARGLTSTHQVKQQFEGHSANGCAVESAGLTMTIQGVLKNGAVSDGVFTSNERGLGVSSGKVKQVDNGEALLISFDEDVVVESAAIVAGNGTCGGFYLVGEHAPLAIYCVDADIDAKDQ